MTPRQSFQLFTAIQLDRVKAIVSQQTPQALHSLVGAPLPMNAPQACSVGVKGREIGTTHQLYRSNRPDQTPAIVRKNAQRAHRYHYEANARHHTPSWLEDCELTPKQLRRRIYNRSYNAGRRRVLRQAALSLEAES